jgi:ATP-dependent Lon protease
MAEVNFEEIAKLEAKVAGVKMPQPLTDKVNDTLSRLGRVAKMGGQFATEFDNAARYIDWVTNLPWFNRSQDILDLDFAQKALNERHYGLQAVKDKILEYLSVLKLQIDRQKNSNSLTTSQAGTFFSRAPILALVGLVGTGKTTLAYSIAKAMGRKFERVPFGGIGDALYLRGQSRAYADAEPGAIIKALRRAGTKNPVILLDEIDRVDEKARATIMGVLVELLDPEQNAAYSDHYIDYPFDLSEVLFIATSNNTSNISTAVLDRLEPLLMPSYTDEEKITIGRDYVLKSVLEEASLPEGSIQIAPEVWPKIVRPLGFDSGIRTLERTINTIVRRAARQIVSGGAKQFVINEKNILEFLPI